eukprot:Skav236516  [mRNA]  locus=scaffold78:805108:810632:+ [translate_table: standard]
MLMIISGDRANRRVFVGNLAYSVTWQELKDHMRGAGDVLFCEILKEPGTTLGWTTALRVLSSIKALFKKIKDLRVEWKLSEDHWETRNSDEPVQGDDDEYVVGDDAATTALADQLAAMGLTDAVTPEKAQELMDLLGQIDRLEEWDPKPLTMHNPTCDR